jgi:hypothetical protein
MWASFSMPICPGWSRWNQTVIHIVFIIFILPPTNMQLLQGEVIPATKPRKIAAIETVGIAPLSPPVLQ